MRREKPAFNPKEPPEHPDNVAAAKARGWTYSERDNMYRDRRNRLIADPMYGAVTVHYRRTPLIGDFW